MRFLFILFLGLACSFAADRPRLAVLTDIGGDPDDQQSLVRLLMYANEFEISLLLASSAGIPGQLREPIVRPDIIRETIQAYGKVLPSLRKHADNWPDMERLMATVKSGNPLRGRDYIGHDHDTEGSRALISAVDASSKDTPLNIAIWGGQTDLVQALWRVRHERGEQDYRAFIRKLRVYDIDDQDKLASWIRNEFPGLFYILAKAPEGADKRKGIYRGMYLTGDESLTSRDWIEKNVRVRGPLGELYPVKTSTTPNPHACMKEGDTPSWFFFLPRGGNDPLDPSKPGWGGRFQRDRDGWFRDVASDDGEDPRHSVSRWRPDFQQDFAKRMSWCKP